MPDVNLVFARHTPPLNFKCLNGQPVINNTLSSQCQQVQTQFLATSSKPASHFVRNTAFNITNNSSPF